MIVPAKSTEVNKKTTEKKVSKAISLINTSAELEANPTAIGVIEECCRTAGVTTELIYKTLRDGLTATVKAEQLADGKIVETSIVDYGVRHKYMLTALELLKHLKDKNVVAVTGIFNDPTIHEDAARILNLRRDITEVTSG